MKYFIILLFSIELFSYEIVDIDFNINMVDSQKIGRTYIIDCGVDDNFVKNGTQFSVFREFDKEINSFLGRVEVYNVGKTISRSKCLEISETIRERNQTPETISVGDICFPSVKVYDNDIFETVGSVKISKRGEVVINNKVLPMILTEQFKKMKIYVYLDSKSLKGNDLEISREKGESLKKFLNNKYDIPFRYLEVEPCGNLQKMFRDKSKKNSFINFVFFPPETIYKDSIIYEEIVVDSIAKPREIDGVKEVVK
ncbi:MAG: hypothetical protein CR982_02905 [Candidatus Cloacimonadota bacterium]|nr:MAG: hypothetical protein CR982_02905 [Candidatus Cloacimonadota bacterium]PIE79218.1 MAG: hypothetical protein CSA15_04100 [Candidatus Delongbacteria bacterium]